MLINKLTSMKYWIVLLVIYLNPISGFTQFTLNAGPINTNAVSRPAPSPKEKYFAKVLIRSDMKGTIYFDNTPHSIEAGEEKVFNVYKKSFYYFLTPNEDYHTNIYDFADKTALIHFKGDLLKGDEYNLRIHKQYLAFKRDEAILEKIQTNFQKIIPENNSYEKYSNIYFGKYEVTVEEYALFIRNSNNRTTKIEGSSIVDYTRKYKFARVNALGIDWKHDAIGKEVKEQAKYPVVNVSWTEVKAYCNWLSEQDPEFEYRLPYRDEWIYFAQCGALEKLYPWDHTTEEVNGMANFRDLQMKSAWNDTNTRRKYENFDDYHVYISPIGNYKQNCFGIYDLGGNVAEWLEDGFTKTMGGETMLHRQFIGGSYFSTVDFADLVALKKGPKANQALPENVRNSGIGFRIVKLPKRL